MNYPHLFQSARWFGDTDVQFELRETLPATAQIASINIVPYIGDRWVIIQHQHGEWDLPGGTLESNEPPLDALARELQEEVGAYLVYHQVIGAWACYSHAERPYRPHFPHPRFYRCVVMGEIQLSGAPSNPTDSELITGVEALRLSEVTHCFYQQGRADLAELYLLAANLRGRQTAQI
ncbi:MAG: NUDIX hydrolase [Anaerolineae bacterium]|jgi:8-oxo-dGTP pyrophosphatase MutT (NUDIX family)|nr:NUDIX hydrolase [Anaerolineae bacterium]